MTKVSDEDLRNRHKALAHPLRERILRALAEGESSPGDLAETMGAPMGVVSYHMRMLRDYGLVELVRTEPRRGALKHFYRALWVPPVAAAANGKPDEVVTDPVVLQERVASLLGIPLANVSVHYVQEVGTSIYDVTAMVPTI